MAEVNIDDLKPNSNKYKSQQSEREKKDKLKSVVDKSSVVSTRKPIGKKIVDTFVTEDSNDIKSWLIMDVIIPGIKNTVLDMLQMAFFGEITSRGRSSRYDSRSRTNYSSYYGGSSRSRNSRSRYDERDRYERDEKLDYSNIILRNRGDAERVIEELRNRIRDCNAASIADLFDLLDLSSKYTDNNWGWTDERDIGIRRVSSGFLIDVAEPRYLD